jgi:TonB family protein
MRSAYRFFYCSFNVALAFGFCRANTTAQERVIEIHAPPVNRDMFDGANHPPPFVPSGAPHGSGGKSVGVTVHLDPRGRVLQASVSQSSGSKLLDEAARCWAQYEWLYPPSATPRAEHYTVTFSSRFADERDEVREARSIIPDTPRPPYPYLARRLHKEGVVGLLLRLRSDGTVDEAMVTRSSGFQLLDLIAKEWAKAYWRIRGSPAREVHCYIAFSLKPYHA